MPNRIGIYFASHHGQTRAIAGAIGQRLAGYGLEVTIIDLEGDSGTRPGLHEFDTVLIGAPIYVRRYPSAVKRFVRSHLTQLRRCESTGFFSVSLTAALGTPEAYVESLGPLREWLSDIAWTPTWIASFGGALSYREYDPLTRWMIKRIAAHYHHTTDTSRDHDLTSWDTVSLFADHVAQNAITSPFRSTSLSLPSRSLDRLMPVFEHRVTEHLTVDARPDEIRAAVEHRWPAAGSGFVRIQHAESHEVIGGLVGQFWKRDLGLQPLKDEGEFVAFQRPGYSKAITDIWFDDAREGGTILRTETRIHSLGPDAPWHPAWYWFAVTRGIRRYVRGVLRDISTAESPVRAA